MPIEPFQLDRSLKIPTKLSVGLGSADKVKLFVADMVAGSACGIAPKTEMPGEKL